jgi:hypothetical protein
MATCNSPLFSGALPNWLDPGCLLTSAGESIGAGVTSALEPVWIILAVVVVLVIAIGLLPNLKGIGGLRL